MTEQPTCMKYCFHFLKPSINTDNFPLGDGRIDSPGHCAQYCSYTMMEDVTKKIITLETMDKRQAGGKSTNLEKACFSKAIEKQLQPLPKNSLASGKLLHINMSKLLL